MGFKRGQKYTIAPNDLEAERKVLMELVEDFQGFPTLRLVLLKRGVSYNFPNIEDAFAFLRKFFPMDRDKLFVKQVRVAPEVEKVAPPPGTLTSKQIQEIILDMSDTKEGTTAKEVLEYAKIATEQRWKVDQAISRLHTKGLIYSTGNPAPNERGKKYFNAKMHPDTVSR